MFARIAREKKEKELSAVATLADHKDDEVSEESWVQIEDDRSEELKEESVAAVVVAEPKVSFSFFYFKPVGSVLMVTGLLACLLAGLV